MNRESFIDRLEAFMKAEDLNANKITIGARLSNGLIGKALKSRGAMNSDSIERILCAYPRLSADWLMTGKGTMYVEELPEITDYMSNTHNNDNLVFFLRDRNKELERENRELILENASLKTRLELLDNSAGKTG